MVLEASWNDGVPDTVTHCTLVGHCALVSHCALTDDKCEH